MATKTQRAEQGHEVEVLVGDCRYMLRTVASRSVQCCITSAPRWEGPADDDDKRIGAEPSPDEYVANLVKVFREVWRTLADNGALWLSVKDGYASGLGDDFTDDDDEPALWGLKNHDLMGIPWRGGVRAPGERLDTALECDLGQAWSGAGGAVESAIQLDRGVVPVYEVAEILLR